VFFLAGGLKVSDHEVLGIENANEVHKSGTRLDLIIIGMLVSSLHATDRLTLGSFFELDLPKKQIGHQPSQPQIFEPEFGNLVVGPARAIGLARVGGRDDCGVNPKQRFAPPVQGHDTHTKGMRDFLSPFPLRRQIICLR
jgi:hypothetical protein